MIPRILITYQGLSHRKYRGHPLDTTPSVEYYETEKKEWVGVKEAIALIHDELITLEEYLEALSLTDYANALITLVKGLRGEYETCNDGSVFWTTEDVEYFENYHTQILKSEGL